MAEECIVGVLERIVFYNDENYFTIGEVKLVNANGRETVTVTGTLPAVQCGETLELTGTWIHNKSYGRQFKVSTFTSRLPASVYGIKKYLGSGLIHGIGKKFAERIVDHFGTETLRVISEESARLREIPGVGASRVKAIKTAWEEQATLREIIIFLQTYGVSSAQCIRLVKAYGNNTKKILTENPYLPAREIDGIAFPTADKIARNLGLPNESEKRIEAGLFYALEMAEQDGHTALPLDDLCAAAKELLDIDDGKIFEVLKKLRNTKKLSSFKAGRNSQVFIQSPEHAKAETLIVQNLDKIQKTPGRLPPILVEKALIWAQEKAGFTFAEAQLKSLEMALCQKLSIITGGPGTGKTTILRALCSILRAKKVRITLAAPTGRAAQRMSEATGVPAGTIHRLLKPEPLLGGFYHNEDHPLETDFLVVDEASMLDNKLAAALLRAVPASASLVLVGDANQLPSVGAGNVLKDLIDSRCVPVTTLNAIFRQSKRSGIVTTAHAILQGNANLTMPTLLSPYEFNPDGDIYFIEADSAEDCCKKTVELAAKAIPRLLGINSLEDIQVLVPMHRGNVGVQNLNFQLQSAFKTGKASMPASAGMRLEIGDKVMQNRNNYDKNVFNGDLGFVERIESESLAVRFSELLATYERFELSELQLAYAMTIHKSQGSEFPIVIIPLVKAHFMMLRRNLIYTAITRGRKKVFLVGELGAYKMAVKNIDATKRWTGLAYRLVGDYRE